MFDLDIHLGVAGGGLEVKCYDAKDTLVTYRSCKCIDIPTRFLQLLLTPFNPDETLDRISGGGCPSRCPTSCCRW